MGLFVSVFQSSGEPVNRPDEIVRGVPYSSGTEFLVGRTASEKEALALRQVLLWKLRHFCSLIVLSFGNLGTICFGSSFAGAADDVPCFSGAGDVWREEEVKRKRRRKHAAITRRFVPLSGQEPGPV